MDIAASGNAAREQAVRAVIDAASLAWSANDAAAFVEQYADDATAILPGIALRNRADIHTTMAAAFTAGLKGTRRIHQIQRVRQLNPTVAIVTTRSRTLAPRQSTADEGGWSLATWVLSEHAGRWLIEAYHDCPAA